MSRAAAQGGLSVEARLGGVLAELGALPHALGAAMRSKVYDMLSHHRRSVLSHHRFPSGRRAQQMLASRLYRYTRADTDPVRPAGIVGEAFAAAQSGATFGGETFKQWEDGADISARESMVIPIAAGAKMMRGAAGARARFRQLIERRELVLVERRGKFPLLVKPNEADRHGGERSTIYAVLTVRRRQGRILGFYAQFESVAARHLPRLERVLDIAMKAGGEAAVLEEERIKGIGREAYQASFKRIYDESLGVNGNKRRSLAHKAAELARKAAEREAVGGDA